MELDIPETIIVDILQHIETFLYLSNNMVTDSVIPFSYQFSQNKLIG